MTSEEKTDYKVMTYEEIYDMLDKSWKQKYYAALWNNEISTKSRLERFERIILNGTHFNEDNESNWIRFNYGDISFEKLTPKMQEDIIKTWDRV